MIESAYAQWSGERLLVRAAQSPTESPETIVPQTALPPKALQKDHGSLIGRLQIPRLGLSYVVLEGTDARTLDKSIGHVEGTALLGEPGNIGIAGHRNTHFRKLEWIRRDDDIVLTSLDGDYRYKVEWVRLAKPTDLMVLDPSNGPAVTLITCFPFEYVGAAPLRFIVRALPDSATRARLQPPQAPGPGKPADE